MDVKAFRDVIRERNRIVDECADEWYDGIERCCEQEIQILTENIPSSIEFLKGECTADEYSWISEVLDDIAEQTGSIEFIACYREQMERFPEESEKYNIAGVIPYAEAILEDWEETHPVR